MWTPKRIVMLVLGFAVFCTGYFTYSFVLGGIDGLPPLPSEYLTAVNPTDGDWIPPIRRNKVDEKLGQSFGLECPELKCPIKLELSRNNMVLAAQEFRFDEKGRLVLTPFSVAMFGKPKPDGKNPEINTIRAAVATLTFDRPVFGINPNDMNGRKIVGAELTGDIEVINNRRTARRDDDLELFVKTGPLYYDEAKHLIWTFDEVHVTDRHIDAPPNQVWGKGMELELQVEAPPAPQTPAPHGKPHQESITGVKRITLETSVVMDLYVDGNSGFMNHTPDKNAAVKSPQGDPVAVPAPPKDGKDAKATAAVEKSNLHITTPGRFNYLLFKDYDLAHFEVTSGLPLAGGRPKPMDVTVVRRNKQGTDQLFCQVLDLKLTRKEADQEPGAAKAAKPVVAGDQRDADQNFTIEWVHATADHNSTVTLTSDTENLSVTDVIDLTHEARTGITVLKGNPRLRADKDHNLLFASELHLAEVKIPASDKTYQRATAMGPGKIDLFDKKTGTRPQHAFWNDKLISTKDERTLTAKGEMQDMLILTGAARFEDDEHDQKLQGETLKVWLIATGDKTVEKATPAQSINPGQTAGQAGGAKADHLEAIEKVSAQSRELVIHDTGRLVVWFKDAPPSMLPSAVAVDGPARPMQQLPGDQAPATVHGDVPRVLPPGPVEPPPDHQASKPILVDPGVPARPLAPPQPQPAAPPKAEEPARPLDLSARSVEAWVLREETKNTLEKLWTEGTVHVHQAPAKEGDQPVDITGDTLNMVYHPDGNLLVVTGNEQNLARLQMDKILIVGPEVNIDQAQNKAWVVGAGAMRIDSATTLSGKPLEKNVPLTILWQKSMLVHGRYAEFNVGIQATQEQARMACNTLRVNFDRPISLKEGNKGEQSPKVQTLLCDQNARVEDVAYEDQKLIKYERLDAPIISMEALEQEEERPRAAADKEEGHVVRATGPGWLRLVQRGGTDPLAPPTDPKQKPPANAKPPAAKPGAKPDDDQLKLTLVEFAGSMWANSKTNKASFRKDVRVLNMPVEDPYMELDIDVTLAKLPEGAMYLSCQHLEVYTREEKGKKYQEMHASERAVVQSKEFWGRAATIHFDEFKDQVIFDGGPGGTATLYKMKQVGVEPEQITGEKIVYNRKTGEFSVSKANSLQGGN